MEEDRLETPYAKLARNGCWLLMDLLAQVQSITASLAGAIKLFRENDKEKPSPIAIRAVKTSVIMLGFSALEAIVNHLAALAVKASQGISGSPAVKVQLTQMELDFLAEHRTYVDTSTGSLKISNSFVPILDKLSIVPLLLGKAHGQHFQLDKSGAGWQKIKQLKQIRDKLTHSRTDDSLLTGDEFQLDIENIKPAVIIKNKEIFAGIQGIMWYVEQVTILLDGISEGKLHSQLMTDFKMLEVLGWLTLKELYRSCEISEKQFNRDHPMPKGLSFVPRPS